MAANRLPIMAMIVRVPHTPVMLLG